MQAGVWFLVGRNGSGINENGVLTDVTSREHIYPVSDDSDRGSNMWGFEKMGVHRRKWMKDKNYLDANGGALDVDCGCWAATRVWRGQWWMGARPGPFC